MHSRPLLDPLQPRLQVRVGRDVNTGAVVDTDPAKGLDISNTVLFASQPLMLGEVAFKNGIETLGLVQVSVDGIRTEGSSMR